MALLAPETTRAISAVKLEEIDNYDPIPAGTYNAKITKVEVKDTKAGTGKYLNVSLQITGPSYQGRMVFDIINVQNPSQTAVDIGIATMKKIAVAIGETTIQDTDQMIGADVEIKVKVKNDKEFGPKNVVKDYKPVGSSPTGSPTNKPTNRSVANGFNRSAPTPPPPSETGSVTPPWMRA